MLVRVGLRLHDLDFDLRLQPRGVCLRGADEPDPLRVGPRCRQRALRLALLHVQLGLRGGLDGAVELDSLSPDLLLVDLCGFPQLDDFLLGGLDAARGLRAGGCDVDFFVVVLLGGDDVAVGFLLLFFRLILVERGVEVLLRNDLASGVVVDGLAFLCLALDFFDLSDAEGVQVALVVGEGRDGVGDDLEAHKSDVLRGELSDLVGEGCALAVDLLDGEGAQDGALVALHGALDGGLDLGLGGAEEVLGGEADGVVIAEEAAVGGLLEAGDLDLADAEDVDGDALEGGGAVGVDLDGAELEGEAVDALEAVEDEGAAADADARVVAAAGDDERGVGADGDDVAHGGGWGG
mmetsp:Transcript_19244/g.48163  ORF Transcript_19244/g.48163 Transcript_19244/m.48163 type:complete len:350 (+) Transcript_19244:1051-2100(+)